MTVTPTGSYNYAVTAGSLPPGLMLFGSFGLIYGYPTTAGSFAFTITATDTNNCTGSKAYSLQIGGAATRSPVVGDFDSDRKMDMAVFRRGIQSRQGKLGQGQPGQGGEWFIKRSSDGAVTAKLWGLGTDVPVAADYDGDGKADIAVRRGAYTNWYIIRSSDGTVKSLSLCSSALGEMPAPGDFDGDGKADAAIRRAKEGHWHILGSRDGKAFTQSHDAPGDLPITVKAKP